MKRYKYIDCGLIYDDKKIAKKCQNWCSKHKSCNLEIKKHAINKNEKVGEKMKTYKISIAFGILLLSALNIVSAVQYGMMGDNGQFTAVNNGGMGGMTGMMNMMTGYGGYNAGAVLLSWITYSLTIALMIAGIYWLVKTANRKR